MGGGNGVAAQRLSNGRPSGVYVFPFGLLKAPVPVVTPPPVYTTVSLKKNGAGCSETSACIDHTPVSHPIRQFELSTGPESAACGRHY
jgi:hypothetical protein